MRRNEKFTFRREIPPIPANVLQDELQRQPKDYRRSIRQQRVIISDSVKGIGDFQALEIIWAIGRLLNREMD